MTQQIKRRDGSVFEAADDYVLRDGEHCHCKMVLMDDDDPNAKAAAEQRARIAEATAQAEAARNEGIRRTEEAWKTSTGKGQ